MASQNQFGQVVLGDSHQYGLDVEPFDDARIDQWILRELRKIIRLPTWEIESRWHGIYAKYSEGLFFERTIAPGLHVFTGLGGNGMTLSFGLAEEYWDRKLPNQNATE
jgi:glycine/D-amino acid oxidase-like deaminating enzyme